MEIDYLQKIGINFKGSEITNSEKKFIISINLENDSPQFIDILK